MEPLASHPSGDSDALGVLQVALVLESVRAHTSRLQRGQLRACRVMCFGGASACISLFLGPPSAAAQYHGLVRLGTFWCRTKGKLGNAQCFILRAPRSPNLEHFGPVVFIPMDCILRSRFSSR